MDATDLAKLTKKALLTLAKQHGIKGVSRLRKKELADRLLQMFSPSPQLAPSKPSPQTNAVEHNQQSPEAQEMTPQGLPLPASPTDQHPTPIIIASVEQSEQDAALETTPTPPTSLTAPPAAQSDREATDSKFFLGVQPPTAVAEPDELPASYNDNRLVLLARDPHGVHAYWDFNGERWTQAQNQRDAEDNKLVLRIFDVTYIEFTGANSWSSTDVELTPFATSWYVSVPRADAAYCAEIGYRSHSGRFVSLGRSNVAITPRNDVSPSTTVRWLTPPERRASVQSTKIIPSPAQSQERPFWTSTPPSTPHLSVPSSSEHLASSDNTSSWGGYTSSQLFPPKAKEST
ncbi:MAG: DUF4912 domain-containing protein [Candidatus Binatia bacterium]